MERERSRSQESSTNEPEISKKKPEKLPKRKRMDLPKYVECNWSNPKTREAFEKLFEWIQYAMQQKKSVPLIAPCCMAVFQKSISSADFNGITFRPANL